MQINEKECEKAGLDIKKVKSIARRISKAAKEAGELGIEIFGGSGTGELRYTDNEDIGQLKIARLDGCFSGGDGGDQDWGDGYLRGE
jgi:hypothetical protein